MSERPILMSGGVCHFDPGDVAGRCVVTSFAPKTVTLRTRVVIDIDVVYQASRFSGAGDEDVLLATAEDAGRVRALAPVVANAMRAQLRARDGWENATVGVEVKDARVMGASIDYSTSSEVSHG